MTKTKSKFMDDDQIFELVKEHFTDTNNLWDRGDYEEQLECNEQLLECLRFYHNCEYITKASIDFEKSCVHLIVVPPVSLERIKIDCVLADKEND